MRPQIRYAIYHDVAAPAPEARVPSHLRRCIRSAVPWRSNRRRTLCMQVRRPGVRCLIAPAPRHFSHRRPRCSLLGRPRQPYAARVTGTLAALALAVDLNLTGRTRRRQSARSRVTASSHMRYTAATVYPDVRARFARRPSPTVRVLSAQYPPAARRSPSAVHCLRAQCARHRSSPAARRTPPHPPNPVHTAALEAALQALTALAALRTAPDAAGWYETRPHAHVQEAVLTNRLTSAALYNPGRIAVLPLVCVWRDERTVVVFVHLVLTAAMDAATADCEARDDPCE
ncbi:hypothetical protein GGX14DRAFT_669716 [Mycena pura]|uniref:Uncharacterized protein n=1 Tax=Mycena pura TaxID=153505 RepID=A0AAD6VSF5_9AGAR|nr:hypothetical protein GGX14DRAFT_669716 [Mycena pura]